MKLVAQYGDACNVGGGDPATIRQKLDVLKRHCDNEGRDYGTITKSTSANISLIEDGADLVAATALVRGATPYEEFAKGNWVGTADQISERIQSVVDAGIDYLIVYLPRIAYDQTPVRRFAEEIIPRFA